MNLRILLLLAAYLVPSLVFAADGKFIPIAPIPNPIGGGLATDNTLPQYVNSVFQIAIAVGAALAAIFIAIGGFEYIFSEAMDTKKNGRMRITQALLGLGILLLVTLILYVINPDLIKLNALQ
jgi:succinate dehydrogenase/fumarate reductase cytochrome b subunit